MCSCDFDPPSAMTETRRRARKPHWCVECRSPISVGETYVYVSGVWDGRGDSFRLCATCSEVSNAWYAYAREHRLDAPCWAFGEMWDCIREWIADSASVLADRERKAKLNYWGIEASKCGTVTP